MSAELESEKQTTVDAETWISLLKRYSYPTELTAELLNGLIKKINASQTLVTKIFNDKDKSDNFVRVGNNIVVDYQSGLLMGSLPSGYNDESIMNIYYIDNFSAKNITTNNGILVWTRNSVAE